MPPLQPGVLARSAKYNAGILDVDARGLRTRVLGATGAYGRADVFAPDEALPLVSLAPLVLPLAEVFELEPSALPA